MSQDNQMKEIKMNKLGDLKRPWLEMGVKFGGVYATVQATLMLVQWLIC